MAQCHCFVRKIPERASRYRQIQQYSRSLRLKRRPMPGGNA